MFPTLVRLWAISPIIGYLPGVLPRIGAMWWWVLCSVLLTAYGQTVPVKRNSSSVFGWALLLVFWLFLTHLDQADHAYVWLVQAVCILSACAVVTDRGSWSWVKEMLVLGAFIQVPFMVYGFLKGDQVLVGTLGKRPQLSILLGFASIWSYRYSAMALAALSAITFGLTGAIPAVFRLTKKWLVQLGVIWVLAGVGIIAATSSLWWVKLSSRLNVWQDSLVLKNFFLRGYGFLPFPVGFLERREIYTGATEDGWIDFHNSFLDFSVRGGLIGVVALLAFFMWAWKRCKGSYDGRWLFGFSLWVGFWQSIEAMPAAVMCFLCWVIWMSQKGEAC